MDLYIYTPDTFKLLDVVDTAKSVIWTNRFRECGDFEIYVAASTKMAELLQEGRLVRRLDNDMVGIIEGISTTTDDEEGDFLIITGRSISSILDRRIVWEQTTINGTLENGLRKLVNDAFISPTIAARKCDFLSLAGAHGYTEKINTQYTGDNILDVVIELCAAHNYGFKMLFTGSGFVLDFYKGVDRSKSQTDRIAVVFSEEYDNLLKSTYTKDTTQYKSVALIAGEGEGKVRRQVIIERNKDTTGLNRRELFVDARDISSNEGEITEADYLAQLAERGRPELAENGIIESLEGEVTTDNMYVYGVDYNLGDVVTVITKYGIQANACVLEIMEKWDEDGYSLTPTFG